MNQVSLIGRIVKDLEAKEVGQGGKVVNNTLAVRKRGGNTHESDADFIPFVVWNKLADLLVTYSKKGHLIGLNGRLNTRSYANKYDQMVYVVELIVEELTFIEPKERQMIAEEVPELDE